MSKANFNESRKIGVELVSRDASGNLLTWRENGYDMAVARDASGNVTTLTASGPAGSYKMAIQRDAKGNYIGQVGDYLASAMLPEIIGVGGNVLKVSTSSDGQLVFDAAASAAIKRAAVGTPSPAILYDDDVVFTATELIRAAGGYVKQIRCISGTATLDLYDSVDWTGRKLYTGTVSAGDVIDVNAIALNGVSAKVVGTVSISISHTEII